jgi:hypothetical protein
MASHTDRHDDPKGSAPRPTDQERAEALRQVCRAFQQVLGVGGEAPAIAMEDEPYQIPMDGSELLVIHHLGRPPFVKSYLVYCEPGNPLLEGEYRSLDQFIRRFYSDKIELSGRRAVPPLRGFPPRPGSRDGLDAALRYLDALENESSALDNEITAWIAAPPQRQLERIIWA